MRGATLAIFTVFSHHCADAIDNPIIGIIAHPSRTPSDYIGASYVKWVECAGGRVIPIPYDADKAYLDKMMPQLNGFLFPGGDADMNENAKRIYKEVIELNDNNQYFPIWGTCLGLEWLLQLTADDTNVIDDGFDSFNISLPLTFTDEAPQSKLFAGAQQTNLYKWLAEKPITMNNHERGILLTHFRENEKLSSFYKVLSTNTDRLGKEFVSAYEAIRYPIYAVQFHPEKSLFEFGEYPNGMPYQVTSHTTEAVQAAQYFANFFVNEARKSDAKFVNPLEKQKSLIYKYTTTNIRLPGFVEVYFFKHKSGTNTWVPQALQD